MSFRSNFIIQYTAVVSSYCSISPFLHCIHLYRHNTMPNHPCPATCGRFFRTIGGLNSHLSSSKSCRWYVTERLHELDDTFQPYEEAAVLQRDDGSHVEEEDFIDYNPQLDPDGADLPNFQELLDEFVLIPDPPWMTDPEPQEGEAGPGPQTALYRRRMLAMKDLLDEDADERVTDEDVTSARILRQEHLQTSLPTQDRDGDANMATEGEDPRFHPFISELDWKIANWAIKDGPGHNAFNRLLNIPGVSC